MQVLVGESCVPPTPHFVFMTQPPTEPLTGMVRHLLIGMAHRTQTEVVCPADQHLVQPSHSLLGILEQPLPAGHFLDPVANRLDLLLRWALADVANALRRVAPSEGVTQKIERLVRKPTDVRLLFVNRVWSKYSAVAEKVQALCLGNAGLVRILAAPFGTFGADLLIVAEWQPRFVVPSRHNFHAHLEFRQG